MHTNTTETPRWKKILLRVLAVLIALLVVLAATAIAQMDGEGRINGGTAKKVLAEIWESGADPEQVVREQGLEQISDPAVLGKLAQEVIDENAKVVADYKNGKGAAFGALMGKMMAKTQGKCNPAAATKILKELL